MLLYYLTREGRELMKASHNTDALEPKHLCTFRGRVVLTKYRDAVFKKGGNTDRFTLFDDSQTPPILVQYDYSFTLLHSLGATLPSVFINFDGDLIQMGRFDAYGGPSFEILMRGPELSRTDRDEVQRTHSRE